MLNKTGFTNRFQIKIELELKYSKNIKFENTEKPVK